MKFDKWFYKQSKLVQIILLLIPFVNWIVEILVRVSIASKKGGVFNWLIFLFFLIFGISWVVELIDIIFVVLTGKLLFG